MLFPQRSPDPMNPTQELTQGEKEIKIAEACGWVEVTGTERQQNHYGKREWRKDGVTTPEGWDGHYAWDLPNYFSDLNAMHSAEKVLTREQWSDYTARLNSDMAGGSQGICQAICHAAAAQRAEAFGKTLGLWP
jgi:hypothetical protein